MNIKLNVFSDYAVSLFKENVLPSLTSQQKKIILIASIALGLLAAAWYFASKCSFGAKKMANQEETENSAVKGSKSMKVLKRKKSSSASMKR